MGSFRRYWDGPDARSSNIPGNSPASALLPPSLRSITPTEAVRHPSGKPFFYFLAAGLLLLADIPLLPALTASSPTFKRLIFEIVVLVFVPFFFVPQLIYSFEKQWIRYGSVKEALARTSWAAAITMASVATGLLLAWLSVPWIVASRIGPPRPMTREEAAALSQKIRDECGAFGRADDCFEGLRALFANGFRAPDLAPVLVRLSERDPEVRAYWRNMGFLLERGEIAHRYRSRLLDMLGLLGPAAADVAQPELVARLSDPEERSRWAAAGALGRFDSLAAGQRAAAFFSQNVPALVDRYRVDRSRGLRTCLFLLRAELKDSVVRALALDALDDNDARVGSCGAFLLLTSGVPPEVAEARLLGALARPGNHYARDSFAAALEILATPRALEALRVYTGWQPERVQTIRERWNDPYFRLFGDLL